MKAKSSIQLILWFYIFIIWSEKENGTDLLYVTNEIFKDVNTKFLSQNEVRKNILYKVSGEVKLLNLGSILKISFAIL